MLLMKVLLSGKQWQVQRNASAVNSLLQGVFGCSVIPLLSWHGKGQTLDKADRPKAI
jgi:hypothetical protein